MIEVKCDKCQQPLTQLGALAFSPPSVASVCVKIHMCVGCFDKFIKWMREDK